MKKYTALFMSLLFAFGVTVFSSCSTQPKDPGEPPDYIIDPDISSNDELYEDEDINDTVPEKNTVSPYEGDILEDAVAVQIGQTNRKEWSVNMYNNAASVTMLDYLTNMGLLFPTYTYDEEEGFVAQNVRGSYTRNDEITVADVKTGELYLFSGGQLRFYFKDVEGANITATPIGYYTETEGLTDAVIDAYQSNLGDYWGVDVYFIITKTID